MVLIPIVAFPVQILWLIASPIALLRAFRGVDGEVDPPPRVPDDLAVTAAPRTAADGSVACTHCGAFVSWDSMSIDDRGYFCTTCATAV
jgi:hypothetical protein